ncbi:nucleotidyltransferase domain-containing protein [Tamaricihabitans halophyticus]|nr:nucleotidyltransferase domain-containing protein [Tamaricihabitans halophyticus]
MSATAVLPTPVARVASQLAEIPGVLAVVLGGSRATGVAKEDSDWDLGVYYRAGQRVIDPADVRALGYPGYVSALGEWGPIVHGGAWLKVDGIQVDVLFRDLDQLDAWRQDAERGEFEVLTQAGHLVGAPTYLPIGELASCLPIHGTIDRPEFPAALAESAPARWFGQASVGLMFADGYAGIGDVTCCAGALAQAVLCVGHARLAAQREWVLGEKRLIDRAGLAEVQPLLANIGEDSEALQASVAAVRAALGIEALHKSAP